MGGKGCTRAGPALSLASEAPCSRRPLAVVPGWPHRTRAATGSRRPGASTGHGPPRPPQAEHNRSAPGKKKGYPLAAAPRKCVSCPSLLPYLRVVRDADRHGVALQLGPLVGGRVLDVVRDWEWRVERRGGRRDKRDVSVGGVARVRRERGHIPAAARAARSRLCLASLGSPQTLTAPPPARAWLGNPRGRSPVERPSPAHSLFAPAARCLFSLATHKCSSTGSARRGRRPPSRGSWRPRPAGPAWTGRGSWRRGARPWWLRAFA